MVVGNSVSLAAASGWWSRHHIRLASETRWRSLAFRSMGPRTNSSLTTAVRPHSASPAEHRIKHRPPVRRPLCQGTDQQAAVPSSASASAARCSVATDYVAADKFRARSCAGGAGAQGPPKPAAGLLVLNNTPPDVDVAASDLTAVISGACCRIMDRGPRRGAASAPDDWSAAAESAGARTTEEHPRLIACGDAQRRHQPARGRSHPARRSL